MANEQSRNGEGEYQIDEITYVKEGLLQMRTCEYKGKEGEMGVEKLVIKCVRAKGMVANKCCGIFFVHWSGQVH